MRSLAITISILLCVGLVMVLPAAAQAQVSAVLTWEGDADLDLELWTEGAYDPIGKTYNLGGSEDDQGPNGRENFTIPQEEGVYVLAVSYENGNDRTVTATLRVGDQDLSAQMNATDGSLWFAFEVNAETGEVTVLDRYW